MKLIGVTLLLAASVLSSPLGASVKDELTAIQPLQFKDADGAFVNSCTAWKTIVSDGTVWVTALHCLTDDAGVLILDRPWFINGTSARVGNANSRTDLVTLRGSAKGHSLRVAYGPPEVLAPLWTAGYPRGSKARYALAGVLSQPRADNGKAVFNMPTTNGMSGAPVLDKDGLVVGLMLQMECHPVAGWCAVSRGASVADLREFLFGEA